MWFSINDYNIVNSDTIHRFFIIKETNIDNVDSWDLVIEFNRGDTMRYKTFDTEKKALTALNSLLKKLNRED